MRLIIERQCIKNSFLLCNLLSKIFCTESVTPTIKMTSNVEGSEIKKEPIRISALSKKITFITGNEKKLQEFKQIMGTNLPFELVHQKIDLTEVQGELNDICRIKCAQAQSIAGDRVLVEDTCLCFNALKGLPGPYVKSFLDKIGPEGLFKMLHGFEDKTAQAICTFAFGDVDGKVRLFQGIVNGKIVEPRGSNAFGWDSCFQPDGYEHTYGEMEKSVKNTISHRYEAIVKLKDFFKEYKFDSDNSTLES